MTDARPMATRLTTCSARAAEIVPQAPHELNTSCPCGNQPLKEPPEGGDGSGGHGYGADMRRGSSGRHWDREYARGLGGGATAAVFM
nr:unnamed protein product [Digitaria exilis]